MGPTASMKNRPSGSWFGIKRQPKLGFIGLTRAGPSATTPAALRIATPLLYVFVLQFLFRSGVSQELLILLN